LTKLNLGFITQIPLDYLHLVCLGVTRKLFRQWIKGKLPYRLKSRDSILIGDRLNSFRSHFSSDFPRKPRSILHIDHYKGTEFRALLLYSGVVALRGVISAPQYKNFLCFHTAMYILLSKNANNREWNNLAKNLLQLFVENSINLYGKEFAVYNVHGLLHIHEDALLHGSLDNASTFPFENYMQKLKSFIHSHNFHLEQVAKRILESEEILNDAVFKSFSKGTILHNACKKGNNCFMLNAGIIVVIRKCVEIRSSFFLVQKFNYISRVKEYPVDSRKLGIFKVMNLSNEYVLEIIPENVNCRLIKLPFKRYFICIPVLHTIK